VHDLEGGVIGNKFKSLFTLAILGNRTYKKSINAHAQTGMKMCTVVLIILFIHFTMFTVIAIPISILSRYNVG